MPLTCRFSVWVFLDLADKGKFHSAIRLSPILSCWKTRAFPHAGLSHRSSLSPGVTSRFGPLENLHQLPAPLLTFAKEKYIQARVTKCLPMIECWSFQCSVLEPELPLSCRAGTLGLERLKDLVCRLTEEEEEGLDDMTLEL